jgi:hypothetical protein
MARPTAIFLRQPSGVRIETHDNKAWEYVLQELDVVSITRVNGDTLVVPVDNIASVEVPQ